MAENRFNLENQVTFNGSDIGIGGTLLDEELNLTTGINESLDIDLFQNVPGIGVSADGVADLEAGLIPFFKAAGSLIDINFSYPTTVTTNLSLDNTSDELIFDTGLETGQANLAGKGLDAVFEAGIDLLADVDKAGLEDLLIERPFPVSDIGPKDFLVEDQEIRSNLIKFDFVEAFKSGLNLDEAGASLEEGVSYLASDSNNNQDSDDDSSGSDQEDDNDSNNTEDDTNTTTQDLADALKAGTTSDFGFIDFAADAAIDTALGLQNNDDSNDDSDEEEISISDAIDTVTSSNPVTVVLDNIEKLVPGLNIDLNLIPNTIQANDSNASSDELESLEASGRQNLGTAFLDFFEVLTTIGQKATEPTINAISQLANFDEELGPFSASFSAAKLGPDIGLDLQQEFAVNPDNVTALYTLVDPSSQNEILTLEGQVGETLEADLPDSVDFSQENEFELQTDYELNGQASSSFNLVPTLGGQLELIQGSAGALGEEISFGPFVDKDPDFDLAQFEVADFNFNFDDSDVNVEAPEKTNTIKASEIPEVSPEEQDIGPSFTSRNTIQDGSGETAGAIALTLPTFADSENEIPYKLDLSSASVGEATNFNFAYIIDTSGSMGWSNKLGDAQKGYESLTDSLIEQNVANESRFAVIPFDFRANTIGPLTAEKAIDEVNSLSDGGGTNFGPPVVEAIDFFEGLASGTNVGYFLSDGEGSLPSQEQRNTLQDIADVRAFGIGNANQGKLSQIDSDSEVPILENPEQLSAEFESSGFDRNAIERVEISLNDNIIETISAQELKDTSLGLSFNGKLDGLSESSNNEIEAQVIFDDSAGLQDTEVSSVLSDGSQDVTTTDEDGDPVTRLGRLTKEASVEEEGETLIGNNADNVLKGGESDSTLIGGKGNNTFFPGEGDNQVKGSEEGTDTVIYDETRAERGPVNKTGNVVEVGTGTDTLTNVEFIEFADQRVDISGDAVETAPPALRVSDLTVAPDEGSASFELNLSQPVNNAVDIPFETVDGTAKAGIDYEDVSNGTATIPAEEESTTIDVAILDSNRIEPNATFDIQLSDPANATFVGEQNTLSASAEIVNNNAPAELSIDLKNQEVFIDSDSNTAPLDFSIQRSDNLEPKTEVAYEVSVVGQQGTQLDKEIKFAVGQNQIDRSIDLIQDIGIDPNEDTAFTITLAEPSRDATLSAEAAAAGTITVNEDPIVEREIPDQSAEIGESFNFQFPQVTFDDPNGGDLNYSLSEPDTLPEGIDFDATKRTFSGTPQEAGNFDIEVVATDEGGATVSDSFELEVAEVAETALNLVEGTEESDRLAGTEEDDRIVGKESRDLIRGGKGNDIINPGSGRDVIVGQAGEDQFVLKPGNGPNEIRDFTLGEDELALGEELNFADLGISNTRTGTRIAVEESDEVLADLFGIQAENVSEQDFATIA